MRIIRTLYSEVPRTTAKEHLRQGIGICPHDADGQEDTHVISAATREYKAKIVHPHRVVLPAGRERL